MIKKAIRIAVFGVVGFLIASTQLLAADPNKVRQWIDQLRQPVAIFRAQAASKLAEMGKLGDLADSALEPMSRCLADTDSNVRLYASYALGRIEADAERSVILLLPLLADSDEHVRYSAEWSLAEIAKSISGKAMTEELAGKLVSVFAAAEEQMSKGNFQDRHILAVKLARTRLANHQATTIEPPKFDSPKFVSQEFEPQNSQALQPEKQPEVPPVAALPEATLPVVAPSSPTPPAAAPAKDSESKTMLPITFYQTNDIAGRLLLVDRMASDAGADDTLRLAVLKHELQSDNSFIPDFALSRWQPDGQRFLGQLFNELTEVDLNTPYAARVIQSMVPDQAQLTVLCQWANSTQRSVELRLASLKAIKSASKQSATLKASIPIVVPMLQKIAADSGGDSELQIEAIQTIAEFGENAASCRSILLGLIDQAQLSLEVRVAAALALSKICPNSTEVAGALAASMKPVAVDDDLFRSFAEALGDFGPAGEVGVERLVEGLRASEASVRIVCAESLEKIGESGVRATPSLVARIADTSESVAVKNQCANALSKMGEKAFSLLMEQLQHPEGIVREHTLRALVKVANSNAALLEPSLMILTDTYEKVDVRAAAATAIGSVGRQAQSAIPALFKACEPSQAAPLRAAAMIALGRIEPSQAQAVAQANLRDPDLIVRASAAFNLHLCGDTKASVESLLLFLDGSECDEFVCETLVDIGPNAIPWMLQCAQTTARSRMERACCVQAIAAMPEVPWSSLAPLLNDDDIGDDVAGLMESADLYETNAILVLVDLLRDGSLRGAARARVIQILEADGFGAADDEEKWDGTLTINQPGSVQRLQESRERHPQISAMSSAAIQTNDEASVALPKKKGEMYAEFSPQEDEPSRPRVTFQKEDDRKVSVFYGTNRNPILPLNAVIPISSVHVVLAVLALATMVGCFFLFPRHSNFRYAIASLVGMGAVSTVALQMMLLTDWQADTSQMLCYGGEYSDEIQYGICEVSIPEGHQPGELESPKMFKMEVTKDPRKHIVLTNVEQLSTDGFHAALKTEMDRSGKNIFVFIHGYNVSFEDAARRTGQMAYDLKFPGAPVFYSWPSQANWYGYAADKENIALSTSQIRTFLLDIAEKSNADTINLIAHSMGNVGLTAALSEMEQKAKPRFNQVVLAAPDIDAQVFKKQIATRIIKQSTRTTLYTSKSDLALIASRYFNQGNRVGDSGAEIFLFDGIETIDATAVDSSLLGHSYYGSNATVLDDLGLLLQNRPIESRHYLKSVQTETRPYWAFEPVRISRSPSTPALQR